MKKFINTPRKLALVLMVAFGSVAALLSINATDMPAPTEPALKRTLVESKTFRVVKVKQIQPANVHEEINIPIYRVYWDNGDSTKMWGTAPQPGDSTSFQTYQYK